MDLSHLAAPAFAAAAIHTDVVATVPVGDRRLVLFARFRVEAGSAVVGRRAATLDRTGSVRLLAVAEPDADEARWEIPPDEILEADEEIVVAATREGLGELIDSPRHLAPGPDPASAAGRTARRTMTRTGRRRSSTGPSSIPRRTPEPRLAHARHPIAAAVCSSPGA